MKITAYFDGACAPFNPGGTTSFGAFVLVDNKQVWQTSKLFKPKKGEETQTSNNVGEYNGLIAILNYLKRRKLTTEEIVIYGDSNLVINQMFGTWKITGGIYMQFALKAKQLLTEFSNITGHWIPREANGMADNLSKLPLIKVGIKV